MRPAAFLADRGGTTAVEFALVAPLLLALLVGALEAGRLLWFGAALGFAVDRAARCAELAPDCGTEGAIRAEMEAALASLAVPVAAGAGELVLAPEPCGTRIEAHLAYPPLVPGLVPLAPTLSAHACAIRPA